MDWIDAVWPMMAAASLTLGFIHALVWLKQKTQTAHLMFALTATSVAALALIEVLMLDARTPELYGVLLRWAHVPFALMIVGLVSFVRLHLHVGNLWLGLLACVCRLASLFANFLTGVNLNFREITSVRQVPIIGGDFVALPIGVANPWVALGQLSIVLLVLFLLDAIVSAWRHGPASEWRRVLFVCGSILLFIASSAMWSQVVVGTPVYAPLTVNPAFLVVLVAVSYDLGIDILRAAQLAQNLTLAESNLHDSEQRMDLAIHAAGIGLWNWDIARGESWYSEPGLRMLGFAPGEPFEQAKLQQRIHPDDRDSMRNALADAVSSGGRYRSEYRIAAAEGGTRWIAAQGQVEFDADQVPLRMRGVVADISQRGQAEESLRLVVEASPAALLMVDARGSITLANRQAEIVFGYVRAELLQMNVDALVSRRDGAWHAGRRAAYAAAATARPMGAGRELFARRKDGNEVPVEIALSPIHSERGLLVLASVMDISERQRSERELAVQRDELAHLSRVVMLAEISGSLAHELNQPLTAILSNAQAAVRFLAHSPPNLDEVRESLANIVENDKRAGEVIRRLRAMLRKDRADYRRLEINDVVMDVLRIIRSDLLNRNVEAVLEPAPNLPPVEGDRVQLQQVLLNLVMNGADAMAEISEGRELILRTQLSDAGGVQVSVCDVGRGIPAADLERIFSPFVTSKNNGMGLGLAVCESIVHAHRGTIWATNNATRGASVHFRLPALGNPAAA
jgi:two-component system, LuxR family, sensor kinase FixL